MGLGGRINDFGQILKRRVSIAAKHPVKGFLAEAGMPGKRLVRIEGLSLGACPSGPLACANYGIFTRCFQGFLHAGTPQVSAILVCPYAPLKSSLTNGVGTDLLCAFA